MNEMLLEKAIIDGQSSIISAVKKLNENGLQFLMVADENGVLIGTVTDGDVRRGLLRNISLNEPVSSVMNTNPKWVYIGEVQKAHELMLLHRIRVMPVLNREHKIVDFIRLDAFAEERFLYAPKNNQVLIMAGGKGTRLDPFTKILPKPLIPVGDTPIIEVIMKKFQHYGFNDFIISLNYKAELIKLYFAENPDGYNISYTMEKEALGTAGAIRLAKDRLDKTFIVSNCDVIVDVDFEEMLHYHQGQRNHATIVGVVKNIQVPYGVIRAKDGDLVEMVEKPEYNVVINSGVYVLEPDLIDLIPANKMINMPDLLLQAKEEGFKVGVFPVSTEWFDVGQWEEYKRTLDYFKNVEGM